jgi:hypothetical protein
MAAPFFVMTSRQRFQAPPRASVGAEVFARPPLADWSGYAALLHGPAWPDCAALEGWRRRAEEGDGNARPAFVAQTPELLADGLHYEQRIAERGRLATREANWHDLFNALVWLRHPAIKWALNARQLAGVREAGPTRRTRAQCALTHFDEAGALAVCADPALLAAWDAHDWPTLFRREAVAWGTRIIVRVFGHALLEHALRPGQFLVAKTLVVRADTGMVAALARGDAVAAAALDRTAAGLIGRGAWLADPQELRPLPLSGIPGWHRDNSDEAFVREAACFRPLRPGRTYPPPRVMA